MLYEVITYSPDIIGFKLWAQNSIKDQINTAKQLKKAYPNAFLLGGGPFVYLFQEYILDMEDSNVFDLWDYGFGEDNILKIIECVITSYSIHYTKLYDGNNMIMNLIHSSDDPVATFREAELFFNCNEIEQSLTRTETEIESERNNFV